MISTSLQKEENIKTRDVSTYRQEVENTKTPDEPIRSIISNHHHILHPNKSPDKPPIQSQFKSTGSSTLQSTSKDIFVSATRPTQPITRRPPETSQHRTPPQKTIAASRRPCVQDPQSLPRYINLHQHARFPSLHWRRQHFLVLS